MNAYRTWQHVFKLDPNKELSDRDLEKVCESGTDAVIVGGTDGVTLDNTLSLLSRVRRYAIDCALEISALEAVTPGFDFYLIPTVLNSEKVDWIVKRHHEAVKMFGRTMNWDEIIAEGYCILNPNAKAARLTEARTTLDAEDVEAYAMMAERMFRLPIFYLEYSGAYGDLEMVRAARKGLEKTRLFYGGGIDSPEKAEQMAEYADTIVVGNAVYENLEAALQTVQAVKSMKKQ
ncbi:heptaprenylglyceryl phosphate synthase [Tuberibacillus calidus]|jgi:putative glycerol-1-phosphate prenyltransferase|uniref:heptaprenylglyceryl phosphate synthase n=1 Tax=Tuberibacillus calidus TaxID=340097 RepID=UPI00040EF31F|nr:heptaprenylglyceryl phosphate synthase [Tuberibacillus calidus]